MKAKIKSSKYSKKKKSNAITHSLKKNVTEYYPFEHITHNLHSLHKITIFLLRSIAYNNTKKIKLSLQETLEGQNIIIF